ncbi:MAG: hypothetical protein IT372_08855 [Polyangiaceae bacterium]|nr:hypothetical protein [Polyangiaceae bacterium]
MDALPHLALSEMREANKALEEAEKLRAEAEKQVEAARARLSLKKRTDR